MLGTAPVQMIDDARIQKCGTRTLVAACNSSYFDGPEIERIVQPNIKSAREFGTAAGMSHRFLGHYIHHSNVKITPSSSCEGCARREDARPIRAPFPKLETPKINLKKVAYFQRAN